MLEDTKFDYVIIDEAAKEMETVILLPILRATDKVILIGDQ